MDRLSALDAAFLELEGDRSSLHIGSLAVFEGTAPPQGQVLDALGRRVAAVPRLRQRLLRVPLSLGRPVWADDPDFRLENHVRRLAVPAPGGAEELHELVDTLMSESLPMQRPLWDDVVIEGMTGDRWALVTRVHHAMADGIAGTGLLVSMLETAAEPTGVPPAEPAEPRAAAPTPGELLSDAARDRIDLRRADVRRLASEARGALGHPLDAGRAAYRIARGLAEYSRALVPVAPSSLIGPLQRERRFLWTEIDLDEVLRVRRELGGTLNDVVLAAVTRGFRDLTRSRDEHVTDRSVRCLVPVSVRSGPATGRLDNEVSAVLLQLPVELSDPRDRLNEVSVRVRALRAKDEPRAGQWLTGLADEVPPAALRGFLHAAFRLPQRSLTTVVTNVPGPPATLYLAGRRMLATYPYVPIADRLRFGIAVTGYDGRLQIGITADRASAPDVDVLLHGVEAGFAELSAVSRRIEARPRLGGSR